MPSISEAVMSVIQNNFICKGERVGKSNLYSV